MWIDEALEIKIELEWIHIGDTEAIGDEGVSATASAYMMIACGLCIADDIPCDEEVRWKTELADDFEFAFHPCVGFEIGQPVSAATAFAGEFDEELVVIALRAGKGLAVVDIAAGEFRLAVVEQGFGIADDLGVGAEGVVDIFAAHPVFIGTGAVCRIELTEHDIEVDAAHQLVDFVAGFVFVGDGLPDDEAVEVVAEPGGIEAVGFGGHDADVLIGAEVVGDEAVGAIDDIDMLHFGGSLGQWGAFKGRDGEEFAELAPAFGIAGEAGVEVMAGWEAGFGINGGGRTGTELDAEDGFDIAFAAFFDPADGAGGVVDIGEGQGRDTPAGGAFCQLFGREGTVFEGVVGMAVEKHGRVKIVLDCLLVMYMTIYRSFYLKNPNL